MRTFALGLLLLGCSKDPVVLTKESASRVRLTVTNQCSYQIWIQQENMPANTPQVSALKAGAEMTFVIPDAGLASTRIWPKTGCDPTGQNCKIGQTMPPCPAVGCAPPVDSKLEATWGCLLGDPNQCAITPQGQRLNNVTWYNASNVDGFTLPFKVSVSDSSCVSMDCSGLIPAHCPTAEDLSQGQKSVHPQYKNQNLTVLAKDSQNFSGCFSPCKKLDYPGWGGDGIQNEKSDEEVMYCCPTPPIEPSACRAGPVPKTQFVAAIHKGCSNGYAYAYDDGVGLHTCNGPATIKMTFGPNCP